MKSSFGSKPIVVKGRGTPVLVAVALISVIALGMPVWLTLTGHQLVPGNVLRIWMVVCGVDLGLVALALYYFSRRLIFDGERVHVSRWFSHQAWPVFNITDLTIQQDVTGGDSVSFHTYLAFWGDNKLLGRLNLFGVPRDQLARFLLALKQANPSLAAAPEVRHLFNAA